MSRDIREALGSVRAPAELKKDTLQALQNRSAKRNKGSLRTALRAAAVCAAAVICFWLGASYGHEAAYVSLDVNPSISISINGFGRVIEAKGYNTASQDILQSVRLTNKEYAAAVESLLDTQPMQPYLEANTDLWIAVQAESAELEEEIEQSVSRLAASSMLEHHPQMQVQLTTVTEQVRASAQAAGLSAGRYAALCELQEAQPAVNVEDYVGASIGEIHDAAHGGDAPEPGAAAADESAQMPEVADEPAQVPEPDASAAPTAAAPAQTPVQQGHHGYEHHGGHD